MKAIFLVIALLLPFESAIAGAPYYAKSFNKKTLKAKAGEATACFYFTVTTLDEHKNSIFVKYPNLAIYITNQSTEIKYAYVEYNFLPWKGKKADLEFENEFGEPVEACVVPGDYSISSLAFIDGICELGRCSVIRPNNFQSISFSLKEDSSVYLGNFYVEYSGKLKAPGRIVVRNRFSRDLPFIISKSKNALRDVIVEAVVNTGSNFVMLNEKTTND